TSPSIRTNSSRRPFSDFVSADQRPVPEANYQRTASQANCSRLQAILRGPRLPGRGRPPNIRRHIGIGASRSTGFADFRQ
ncbi:MAG: hypothetical protein ACK53L_12350, partial [Pirellulaceae bacterium]